MKEIAERLHERRQIELAKSILKSHGYKVDRLSESYIVLDDLSIIDELGYASAVEIRGNRVYADEETLRQIITNLDYDPEILGESEDAEIDNSEFQKEINALYQIGKSKLMSTSISLTDFAELMHHIEQKYGRENVIAALEDKEKSQNSNIKESNEDTSNHFQVGDELEWSGLYGGSYAGKVTQVGEDFIKVEVSWTSEDTGETVTEEEVYDITEDSEGDECIVVWEYRGIYGYVYPPARI